MEKKNPLFPRKPYATHGGAPVPHYKNTAEVESVMMPPPAQVIIPVQQHVGAPCMPLVKVGDTVTVGQKIADSDRPVSAPIHASVSGTVSKISKLRMPAGNVVDAITIDSDGKMTPCPDLKPPKCDTREELIAAIRESGLVGLGGAGFPASVKLNVPAGKKIDTIIVNGAECEPFITADYREAMEDSWEVLSGVYALWEMLGADRVIIAIENNKPEAIRILTQIAESDTRDPDDHVKVLTLKSRYPQGAEKVLVQACTGRKIPQGGLPADVGCLVINITSVSFISRYLKTGMPLVSKRITVDGSAISKAQNVIVPIGTPIRDVIEFCGGYRCEPGEILLGGPMMGTSLLDDSMPVLKQSNAVLAFSREDAELPEPTACIRCGRCVMACPMKLMPTALETQVKLKNVEELQKLNIMSCMECGSCAFVCPAGRRLVQSIRLGKGMVRAAMPRK